MLRHLHAFAWLRWRVLMNTLERTGRRDRLQRFSLATESLGPILLFLMMVPSALELAVAGVVAGFALGRDAGTTVVSSILLRVTAGLALGMSLLAPLFSPAGRAPGSLVRLLLLPIPRSALFASEFAAGLAEPWIAISAPAFLPVPLGALLVA